MGLSKNFKLSRDYYNANRTDSNMLVSDRAVEWTPLLLRWELLSDSYADKFAEECRVLFFWFFKWKQWFPWTTISYHIILLIEFKIIPQRIYSSQKCMVGIVDLPTLVPFDCNCSRLHWNSCLILSVFTVISKGSMSVMFGSVSLAPGIL